MVVAQSEIDLVLNPALRRRMLRLPASASAKAQCPLRQGGVYNLAPRPFAKGQVTVTVFDVRREPLADLSLADSRREGYASPAGAVDAWKRAHGLPADGQLVWVVSFTRGDESEFMTQDRPIYLTKFGDYGTIAGRQAVPGDPELCVIPGAAEQARVMALATRQQGVSSAIQRTRNDLDGKLRGQMISMKTRSRARLIEKEMAKLEAELPVTELRTAEG